MTKRPAENYVANRDRSVELATHTVSLSLILHMMSLNIDMKIIRPWNCSGSLILQRASSPKTVPKLMHVAIVSPTWRPLLVRRGTVSKRYAELKEEEPAFPASAILDRKLRHLHIIALEQRTGEQGCCERSRDFGQTSCPN